ncbi:MAG TPA: hypothetical protein VFM32_01135 [Spongiibacteraceae bacterium]|nr:hypothetical protein [Spongiibacteraceae bacterium]
MLFPTSDADALLLAEHHDELAQYCRLWSNTRDDLLSIVGKEQLYTRAVTGGVNVIPSIYRPTPEELQVWADTHPDPYLIKPGYEGSPTNSLGKKNLSLDSRSELLAWAAQTDTSELIIQRRLRGGDGNIFDCYGLCDSAGRIVTLATHRRWRQHLPDVGATSFGEIPAGDARIEPLIIEQTRRLLGTVKYHGIFGIEWLHDVTTGEVYLIDFNARPFSTISHLADCGLNLPHIAIMEIGGDALSSIPAMPALQHKFWIDFTRDVETYTLKRENKEINLVRWLLSVLRCRSFAYWSWRDPGPALHQTLYLLRRIGRKGFHTAIAFIQFLPIDN